jgi:tripartite-type tricarboxylate transporter receptor subunit TctC
MKPAPSSPPRSSFLRRRARPAVSREAHRLIVTYPPGGGADLMARLVAPKMAEALGPAGRRREQARRGRADRRGEVARAAPDGYTIMLDAANHA